MAIPEKKNNTENIIRLTREELMGSHVDDLVKRYKNMKGDNTIHKSNRHWYLRNWFVYMCVGIIASIAAWSILEPYLDDYYYIQGELKQVSRPVDSERMYTTDADTLILSAPLTHYIIVREDTIWVFEGTIIFESNAKPTTLNINKLIPGNQIGVHVEYQKLKLGNFSLARYVTLNPPEKKPAKASLALDILNNRSNAASFLFFALVAGFIGFALGGIDGLICRLYKRALLGALIGFIVGFIGGFIASFLAGIIYTPFNHFATAEFDSLTNKFSPFGFVMQLLGRGLSWGACGMAMGLGQGVALRSKKLALYGFIGGILGGLFGGLLFDPIDMILLDPYKPSAHWSRFISLSVIGASVGFMIGFVELLARDTWLRMTEGPLAGKEFLLFKDRVRLGSSPANEIYLFNDKKVSSHHATIRAVGDECEIENHDIVNPVKINNQTVQILRLHHGDQITIGETSFIFEKRQK